VVAFVDVDLSSSRLLVNEESDVTSIVRVPSMERRDCRPVLVHSFKSFSLKLCFFLLSLFSLLHAVNDMWQERCKVLELECLLLVEVGPIRYVSDTSSRSDSLNLL
jgi:hypothetical protein